MIEEIKKAKLIHMKNCEKYFRMVQDAESAIKSKTIVLDTGDVNNDKDIPQNDTFMNRSINKVTKIKPMAASRFLIISIN